MSSKIHKAVVLEAIDAEIRRIPPPVDAYEVEYANGYKDALRTIKGQIENEAWV